MISGRGTLTELQVSLNRRFQSIKSKGENGTGPTMILHRNLLFLFTLYLMRRPRLNFHRLVGLLFSWIYLVLKIYIFLGLSLKLILNLSFQILIIIFSSGHRSEPLCVNACHEAQHRTSQRPQRVRRAPLRYDEWVTSISAVVKNTPCEGEIYFV